MFTIFAKLGGERKVLAHLRGKRIGAHWPTPATVHDWKVRSGLPQFVRFELMALALRRGVAVKPSDFEKAKRRKRAAA